ncbi:MAG: methyl-accepting chemotaxis protein [Lachnospiraceae bacterium]|nr:methyl-accepting chemotaxis protein [Lachnospiraceae bacterium]
MKALKNVKMKWKLFALCAPLIAVIIISVVMTGIKVSRTEKEVTAVYYDVLYTVNSNLLSADRDIYQTLNGATFYYDFHKLGSMYSGMTDQALSDYYEKKQSVLDNVNAAAQIASTDELLYTGIVSESGENFQEAYEAFNEAYERWDQQYDLEAEFGSWFHYQTTFTIAREHLDSMQQITNIWTDQKREEIRTQNRISIISYSIIYAVIIAALIVFVTFILRQITASISDVKTSLDALAAGDLTHEFQDEKIMGQDELGSIHLSARNLSEKLRSIIGRTKEMSDMVTASGTELSDSAQQATITSGQVCVAIEEISQGAIGQAESVEVASGNTAAIEENITTIGSIIESLIAKTDSMTAKCNETMATMRVLLDQNAEVIRDVQDIHDQISSTNTAVGSISEASKIITAISSQTNLLSLNASIEAARAGESGRGFAVVATEIGNLADQSGNAAVKISKIVSNLVQESARSVETIEKMNVSFEKQNTHINETETEVREMEAEVKAIAGETGRISEQIKNLMSSKDSLMTIIEELSAVSEENAASAQETNASMEELNATFTLISESAGQLRQLASELNDNISFFTN